MVNVFIPPTQLWDVDKIDSPEFNPNHMSPDTFETLERLIKEEGFLQPLVVKLNRKGDRVRVTDGDHRHKIAQKLGMKQVPCCVLPKDYPDAKARLIQLAMNNLRGDMDLGEVAKSLQMIISSGQIDPTLSGFSSEQIDDMLKAHTGDESLEDLLDVGAKSGGSGRREAEKLYTLEIDCGSAKALKAVKKALREAGDGDLASGLFSLSGVS